MWIFLVSAVHVVVDLLLGGTTARSVLVAVTRSSDTTLAAGEINNGNALLGQLAALDTGQTNIGTVVVVLGKLLSGPAIIVFFKQKNYNC